MIKDKNKKTSGNKKKRVYTADEVATICNCSESYVKQIRAGMIKNLSTSKAKLVLAVDQFLYDGSNVLIKEVARIVKLPNDEY